MTIPDIIYAHHEDIITRDEARHLIDALAHMELSVGLEPHISEDGLAKLANLENQVATGLNQLEAMRFQVRP